MPTTHLLDTDVLSELSKVKPNERVVDWLEKNDDVIAISSITIAEMQYGIERLAEGKKKRAMLDFLQEILDTHTILNWDKEVAVIWGKLVAESEKRGRPLPVKDSMIAAVAMHHKLIMVTRNTKDFQIPGLALLDPFDA